MSLDGQPMTADEWVGELAAVLTQVLDGGPFWMPKPEAAVRARRALAGLDVWRAEQRAERLVLVGVRRVPLPWEKAA